MTRLHDTAAATASHHTMLPDGAPVLVMVSGGGDSVTLLTLFVSAVFGDHPLRVLHVDHLLRGEDSDQDARFVASLCDELGVEFRIVRYDVGDYARSEGLNLEDAGRRVRYRFADEELDAWCEQLRVRPETGRIAVAHTRDDRIETFFMRAIAGAGTGALGSIAPVRGRIVRPLIDCDRDDVRSYLVDAGIAWREDASNADSSRARALVRAELMPVAERLNPGFRASLARTMDLLADDDALLTRMSDGFMRDFAEVSPGEVRFNRDLMRTLERTMARRTVRAALHAAFPESSRIEAAHIEAVVAGLDVDGFARDLGGGLRAFAEYATLVVSYADAESPGVAPTVLIVPGRADLGPAGEIIAEPADPADTLGSLVSVVIDVDSVYGSDLTVDSVREGDRMRPFGMEGTKKLSDLLADAKVPRRHRRMHPVVRDGKRIVWLAGVRMSDDFKVTSHTTRAVRLTWVPDDAVEASGER